MTRVSSAVLDASVLIRASVDRDDAAREWVASVETGRVRGLAPDLVYAEVAGALSLAARMGLVTPEEGSALLAEAIYLQLQITANRLLAPAALALSLTRAVSVYDAHYLALAEAEGATLVTADRRLAEATERSVLVQ